MPPYKQQPTITVQPSAYQQAIIDWLVNDEGNAIVDAKAGSGKTSTLCMLADRIARVGTRAAFLAFNKSIQTELAKRLPSHVQAATFHSICMGILRRAPECVAYSNDRGWVQANKVHSILDQISDQYLHMELYRKGVKQLVGLMKANAMLPDVQENELRELVEKYEIEFDEKAEDGGIAEGMKIARHALTLNNVDLSVIDFDDMLYLCYVLDLPMTKFSHLFIDEAQDTNKMQRILIARMLDAGSRFIAVGDPFQAIYGFRGADSSAMDCIREEFACVTFPLSISYRCPRRVIAKAKMIVPGIEARENAPEGTVAKLDTMKLVDFTTQDLVVCRNTAPLVSLAFKFLRNHKPVKLQGRDIGDQLIQLIQKMRAATLEELADKLDVYTAAEIKKAAAKRNDSKVERLNDQRDSIMAIVEGLPMDQQSVFEVVAVIRRLFTDDNVGNRTVLSTVHRAKGMEAHNVYILDGHLMPSKYATQPWQLVQEQNLKYVAVTRSLDSLYFIDSLNIE